MVHRNGQEANAQPVSEAVEIVEEVSVAVVDSRDEQCLFQGRVPRRVLVVASLGVRCLYVYTVCMYVKVAGIILYIHQAYLFCLS